MSDEIRDAANADAQADDQLTETGSEDTASQDNQNAADSSDAGKGSEPKSMLEAVQAATKQADDETESADEQVTDSTATDSTKDDATGKDTEDDEEEDEATRAADEKRAQKDPRYGKLLRQRARFRDEAKAAKEELDQYKEPAERFQQYTAKIREMGLEARDVNFGFTVMHALKSGDLERAAELLAPINEQIATYKGEKLPEDLQRKINDGSLDEASARELASARAKARNEEERRQRDSERHTQDSQARDAKAFEREVGTSLQKWESELKTRDPDFQRKQPLIMKEFKLLLNESVENGRAPKTIDDVMKMANTAKTNAEQIISQFAPKDQKREVRTVTGGGTAGKTNPQPKSTLDVVKMAARGEYNFSE